MPESVEDLKVGRKLGSARRSEIKGGATSVMDASWGVVRGPPVIGAIQTSLFLFIAKPPQR